MSSAPPMVLQAVLCVLDLRYTSKELTLRLHMCKRKKIASSGIELVARSKTLFGEAASTEEVVLQSVLYTPA